MATPYFLMAMFLSFTRETTLIFLIEGEINVACLLFKLSSTFRLYWIFFYLCGFKKLWKLKRVLYRGFNKIFKLNITLYIIVRKGN